MNKKLFIKDYLPISILSYICGYTYLGTLNKLTFRFQNNILIINILYFNK